MIINPFISVDEQLNEAGYVKLDEGPLGFTFAKHLGGGYVVKAECRGGYICFYDPDLLHHDAVSINDKELRLFAAKIKEWRKQHGRNTETGRHYDKECS